MRLLAPRRISRATSSSTSVAGQDIDTGDWAVINGHTIVVATEDLSVSGGVPIRQRPEIGPWLTPEHLDEWDGIAFSKIDRGFRDHYDFVTFYHEVCKPYGKVIISTGEGIDTSTDIGKLVMGILVQFAEWELTKMKTRRSEAATRLRAAARWGGGTVSFGRMAVCLCHSERKCPAAPNTIGWDSVPDPDMLPVVLELAERAIADPNRAALARWLQDQGVPTPQDGFAIKEKDGGTRTRKGTWRSSSVEAVLRNPGLRGFITQTMDAHGKGGKYAQPKIVRDEAGEPVRREPILDDPTWYRLQAALDGTSKPQTSPRHDAHPLLDAGFCGRCDAPLWAHSSVNKRRNPPVKVRYYICRDSKTKRGCDAGAIQQPALDARLAEEIAIRYSATPYPEKIIDPGVDHTAEIERIDAQLAELDEGFKSGDIPARSYGRLVTDLEAVRENLEAEQHPGGVTTRDADDTVAERYLAASPYQRRGILLDLGVKVTAQMVAGKLEMDLSDGPEPRSAGEIPQLGFGRCKLAAQIIHPALGLTGAALPLPGRGPFTVPGPRERADVLAEQDPPLPDSGAVLMTRAQQITTATW